MNNEGKFERILRPLFEVRSVYAWVFATIWCLLWSVALNFGKGTILILACITLSMATWRFLSVLGLAKLRLALIGKPISFITTDTLQKALPAMGNQLWLGWGFRWQPRHTRRAHELMGRDIEDIYPPTWILRLLGSKRVPANERGLQWIHGLEEKEKDILAPFDSLKGHCAVLATTGAIKTRLVALIMYQLAARGDTVILLDPKGDPELRAICKACAESIGQPERFLMLHPAFASQSVRMDLLKNWDRVSQVASRVSLVLSSEDSTFTDFCWNAVHSITSGMKYVGRRVNIVSLKTAMQSRVSVERLTEEALNRFFETDGAQFVDRIQEEIAKLGFNKPQGKGKQTLVIETGSVQLTAMIQVFNKDLAEDYAEAKRKEIPQKPDEIRGLLAILEANKEWFGKMIVSITPMLTKLSTDDLRGLLSPNYDDVTDARPIMDMSKIVKGKHIFYVGTDTLADPSVGHALASMLLADASAVAAEIYNHGIDGDDGSTPRRIHVFGDEWGDLMCEPLIQQANKGRGAGFFIWGLGQTVSDLVDAFGNNRSKAMRFLGNMNNLIVGATQDPETMQMITEKFGTTTIQTRSLSQSSGSKTEDTGLEFSANRGESLKDQTTELFPPSLLTSMPDLHYVAMINRSEFYKGRIPVLQQ